MIIVFRPKPRFLSILRPMQIDLTPTLHIMPILVNQNQNRHEKRLPLVTYKWAERRTLALLRDLRKNGDGFLHYSSNGARHE